MEDTYTVSLSVRQLVEYVFLSGDIDTRMQSTDALLEGTKAHQRIQMTYGENDRKEVYLRADIACDDLLFVVEGRCDGLLATEPAPTIDEIKSTRADVALIQENSRPVHWAQALFYAYMYARENDCAVMRMQLTYTHKESGEIVRFVREADYPELEREALDMVRRYAPYARQRQRHERLRDESISGLPFPFDSYRSGQRKLAGAVYKTIEEGVALYGRAPTGIGKTISTTYPAIKAIGSGLLQRMIYLTARTTTRTAAEEALQLMQSKGLHLHAATITAKEKICPQEQVRCEKEHCPMADGYYDRINEAVMDVLQHETVMTRTIIEQYARKHNVCPFEFSLDIAYASDVVICDYNYVFDPRIAFKRQYGEGKKRTALLVDEAHNLVDRAREMFSAEISKAPFLALQRELKGQHKGAYAAAKAINEHFIGLRKQADERGGGAIVDPQLPEELVALVQTFVIEAERALESGIAARDQAATGLSPSGHTLLDVFFAAQQFLRTAKLFDERFTVYMETARNDVRLKLFCLDPSQLLRQTTKGYRSTIYFSATLSPFGYFMDMLGGDERDYTLSLASPFPKEQLKVFIQPVSTRYQDRENSYMPIARLIHEAAHRKAGNYMAFFPSYAYMNAVHEAYGQLISYEQEAGQNDDRHRPVKVLLQTANMSEAERDTFLAAFRPGAAGSLIGFAVMGGVFSEGVDLPGDRLIGVIIVGVGLPQLGLERNTLRDYYERNGKDGFQYAYVIPGINKVRQAGGRLIRSETDGGTLTLIDDRYLQPGYRRLLPEEWL